ncbi:MAG: type II toxin-antitoxin system Phd/YefM family antitoxin [Gammaproteobacteria bacterium]
MTMVIMMAKAIPAGEFKAKCLQIMDKVQQSHSSIVITKRGVPVAKLVPANDMPPKLFGALKHSVVINDDVVSPIDEVWDADE